jgi:Zn-finger nucleic acid-binding protein
MMNCPRCETSQLLERERDGVIVDICTGCRGVWLDKGELDKLIAKAVKELDEATGSRAEVYTGAVGPRPPAAAPYPDPRLPHPGASPEDLGRGQRYAQRGYGPPDSDRDPRYHQRRHGKRSWLESLGDLFD